MDKKIKILITGSEGFIGKNLCASLRNLGYNNLSFYDKNSLEEELVSNIKKSDFIFHLAGENRPKDLSDFKNINYGLTKQITEILKAQNKIIPLVFSSSIQAKEKNEYGRSKKMAEDLLLKQNNPYIYIYRLTNVFGKWSKPNYNSVVSTFCYNIANDKNITINNKTTKIMLCYIDDVIKDFIDTLENYEKIKAGYLEIKDSYTLSIGELAETIYAFKDQKEKFLLPDLGNEFIIKLYSTYLSYLPSSSFIYDLKMNIDERGSFSEFFKTNNSGQVSINVSKSGIIKGNHWHHTKNEKFLVVSGEAEIKLRDIFSKEIITFKVSGRKFQVIDIPVGYTHSIKNCGDQELVTVIWANEIFSKEKPDTYYLEV